MWTFEHLLSCPHQSSEQCGAEAENQDVRRVFRSITVDRARYPHVTSMWVSKLSLCRDRPFSLEINENMHIMHTWVWVPCGPKSPPMRDEIQWRHDWHMLSTFPKSMCHRSNLHSHLLQCRFTPHLLHMGCAARHNAAFFLN